MDEQIGPLAFEKDLWRAADKLRGNLHPGEYQHVVLGLVLFRFLGAHGEGHGLTIPASARWRRIAEASPSDVGGSIEQAISDLETANPKLDGLFPRGWGSDRIDERRLDDVVDLLDRIELGSGSGEDLLGRTYEYFLRRFAESDGKGSGEFYTPRTTVELLVELLQPLSGKIYDPCCGSGGMFVQSISFVDAHGGNQNGVSVIGQEMTASTWKLAQMNLLLRGIDFDLGSRPADTLHTDLHEGLRADHVLANPPFNMSDWGGLELRGDLRWSFGDPPDSNANFAWLQHIYGHLADGGRAGVVLANGSLSGSKGAEAAIRSRMIDAGIVDCIVALPSKLFYSTQIAACIWIVSKRNPTPAHEKKVLFLDASRMGTLVSRAHKTLELVDRTQITEAFHSWNADPANFVPEPGFSKAVSTAQIAQAGYILSPPRYVGLKEQAVASSSEIDAMKAEALELMAIGDSIDIRLVEALKDVSS
jgi:type I restriction enzyme M protein